MSENKTESIDKEVIEELTFYAIDYGFDGKTTFGSIYYIWKSAPILYAEPCTIRCLLSFKGLLKDNYNTVSLIDVFVLFIWIILIIKIAYNMRECLGVFRCENISDMCELSNCIINLFSTDGKSMNEQISQLYGKQCC